MKVSSKIISGFLVLILLAIVVLGNQYSATRQMQAAIQDLSELNVVSATTALEIYRKATFITDNATRYFVVRDPEYDSIVADYRNDLIEALARLRETAKSERERAETTKLAEALDQFWTVFNQLKSLDQTWDPHELPPDYTLAVNHLEAQAEVVLDAVETEIKVSVAVAAELGKRAVRISGAAGAFALVLGIIVAAVIVRSINDPLRRLVEGTHALAKGQFWHRLPARGKDEFAELARDFNMMSERLGELDRMKKEFVSHVSHDLKAPLASIRQIMHLLLQEIPGSLNEQQKSLIELSYKSAERLAAMVGNLLDVSRMEAGSMEYRMSPNDMIPLIKSVADEFEVQANQKEIRFRLECDQTSVLAECDRERIVQVVGNLYENALKFSPGRGEIVTRVGQGRSDGEILVSVTDSGPGVPEGHKEKIFQKFHQVKHGKKVAGQGVGLGLAICKTIVEAHRGQIWVEDNPNGGSVFSFVLPAAAREEVLTCGQTA